VPGVVAGVGTGRASGVAPGVGSGGGSNGGSTARRDGRLMADFAPGVPSALSPLVRRIVAPNPSPMTGPGTNTYLVGIDEVAVIDPGPDVESHVDAIIGASMKERVRWVLLTHGHPDHAPATTRLVEATGAEVLAYSRRDAGVAVDRGLADGDVVEGTEFRIEAVHTPGHAPDHVCFHLDEERLLFSGDMILGGTYSVVSPAGGGDMGAYLESLRKLRRMRLSRIAPGHGFVIDDPRACIDDYIRHREERERQILGVLDEGPARVSEIVERIYTDTLPALLDVAAWQVLAHLVKLRGEGRAAGRDQRSIWKAA